MLPIEKIKYIFKIKKSFDSNREDVDYKVIKDIKLTRYCIENNTAHLIYKGWNNTFTFFYDGDIWYNSNSEYLIDELLNNIDILYKTYISKERKKKIKNFLKNVK